VARVSRFDLRDRENAVRVLVRVQVDAGGDQAEGVCDESSQWCVIGANGFDRADGR
jgi:hypothetical protein